MAKAANLTLLPHLPSQCFLVEHVQILDEEKANMGTSCERSRDPKGLCLCEVRGIPAIPLSASGAITDPQC
jgi:hypothetical protein